MAKSTGLFADDIKSFENWLGGDQYLHFIVATIVGFLALWSTKANQKKWLFNLVGWQSIAVLCLVISDEIMQYFIPSRDYSLVDLSINTAGVALGSGIAIMISLNKDNSVNLIK
ncbi:VanZ family protein [Vibrio sp. TH_r3]|uniref:VanZ family protein n=1 Tax=Vibrio sp. TH_r3 TaxID=3082084 RepID=UPI0029540B5F|nr:VanZ family protein [Vibrio sp. TH_r3]MDV7102871.1 VanZ family protein [Vibrio sp. TH_r3]